MLECSNAYNTIKESPKMTSVYVICGVILYLLVGMLFSVAFQKVNSKLGSYKFPVSSTRYVILSVILWLPILITLTIVYIVIKRRMLSSMRSIKHTTED